MPNQKSTTKSERIQARITSEAHEVIARAAEITGVTVGSFTSHAAYEKASQVIKEHTLLVLGAEDSRTLATALIDPPEASDALKRALVRRKELLQ